MFKEQFEAADEEFQEHLILFRERVMGKPTMEERSSCTEQLESVMPLALARLYAAQDERYALGEKMFKMECTSDLQVICPQVHPMRCGCL